MDTKELRFGFDTFKRTILCDCAHLKKNESGKEKKKTQAHVILGKDLTDCNVYY